MFVDWWSTEFAQLHLTDDRRWDLEADHSGRWMVRDEHGAVVCSGASPGEVVTATRDPQQVVLVLLLDDEHLAYCPASAVGREVRLSRVSPGRIVAACDADTGFPVDLPTLPEGRHTA